MPIQETGTAGVALEIALELLESSAKAIFRDPRVRSVGVGRFGNAYGYRAVRNSRLIIPENSAMSEAVPEQPRVPVTYIDTPHEVEHHLQVPFNGPASPTVASHVFEQDRFRPLFSGLQIQNYDNDVRTGSISEGFIIIGSLGCFVRLSDGSPAVLSNNHVLGGENQGRKGTDRIQQAGSGTFNQNDLIAALTDFVALQPSPQNASVSEGNVIFNQVDAAVALIENGVAFGQGFHPSHPVPGPTALAAANVDDRVFKVGRTTGLRFGTVTDVATIVGPVVYGPGPCWFQNSITIEGENGTMFSDKGDSGSIVVRTTGEIVGLLYAGNGAQSYACSINSVFQALRCTLF